MSSTMGTTFGWTRTELLILPDLKPLNASVNCLIRSTKMISGRCIKNCRQYQRLEVIAKVRSGIDHHIYKYRLLSLTIAKSVVFDRIQYICNYLIGLAEMPVCVR